MKIRPELSYRIGWTPPNRAAAGFTLIELMIIVAIAAILSVAGIQGYSNYIADARIARARGDLALIEVKIERYRTNAGSFPPSLAVLGSGIPEDPWGRPYEYLNIVGGGKAIKGQVRKDKNLVPINSDFDLYSRGDDGDTKPPLTAQPSRDDIIRGNNGQFKGVAEDY